MTAPEIIYTGKGRDKKIVITEDLKTYLLTCKDSKAKIHKALGVSRPTLDLLYERCGIGKRETKKQKAVRKVAEQIVSRSEKMEAVDAKAKQKEKQRAVDRAAKELARKSILDRLQEEVKDRNGQPVNYNGETLITAEAVDIALINLARGDHNANLALRAQAMAERLAKQRDKEKAEKKRMIARIKKQRDTRVRQMKKALTDKGVYLTMLDTMLEAWGDAWKLMKIAEWHYEQNGGDTVEQQVTAQAQTLERPNQHYETYRNALKAYNDADQKLRASCNAYYKLAVGDSDEELPGDKATAEILKMLREED